MADHPRPSLVQSGGDRQEPAVLIRGEAVALGLKDWYPDNLFKIRRVMELMSFLAIIIGVPFVYWETRLATKVHQEEVATHKMALTDMWIQKMQGDELKVISDTRTYFADKTITEAVKLERISNDKDFRDELTSALSYFEELGLLFNLDALNKERLLRGPGRGIVQYWKVVEFWVSDYRERRHNPRLYCEFQAMAEKIDKDLPSLSQ